MINLKHCTFLIPYKYDHPDRAANMELCQEYLDKHFDTNILIEVCTGLFHRTKMINKMALKAKTPIVINYDCDVFCRPSQIEDAVNAIECGDDMAYPYDGRFARVPRNDWYQKFRRSLDVSIFEGIEFMGMGIESKPKVGGCVIHNRASFIEAGGENERFISWGHEDRERFYRINALGYKVSRIPGVLYHMDHYMSADSSPDNPYFRANALEYAKVKNMDKEQLKQYICTISSQF